MITVTLYVFACLVSAPATCGERTPTEHPFSFTACLGHDGQGIAQRWAAQHPAYVVRRYSCMWGNRPPPVQS